MRASPGLVFICYIVIQIDIGHHFYSTCALVSLPIPNPNQYPKYYPNSYLNTCSQTITWPTNGAFSPVYSLDEH